MTGSEGREDQEFMAAIEADVVRRLPAAMDAALARPVLVRSVDTGDWVVRGYLHADDLKLVPDVDPMDVTWPDGTFKVFPDRTETTLKVDVAVPDAPSIMDRILAEVRHRRLEETILEELAAIISERGKDAPGLLIIKTPGGEWAIKESEFLPAGCAMLSTLDQPDLMAVAQGDEWLYYRQGPSWGEQMGVPDTATLDIIPDLPDTWGPSRYGGRSSG